MHLQADTSALQEDTGWRPATPFEEGIRETIEWVRKETK
jgi:nucleoside-diphosphate-sugar epimerase